LRRSGWLAAGIAALGAVPVAAQVTAEEVWASNEVYWEALGFDLEGSLRREGAVVTASGITATMSFPLGSGTLALLLPDLLLAEQDDGTVRLEVVAGAVTQVDIRMASGEAMSVPIGLAWADRDAVASGRPGDVTFRLRSGRFDLGLGEVAMGGGSLLPGIAATLDLSIASVDLVTRVTEGEMIGITTESSYGPMIYSYSVATGSAGTEPGSEERKAGRVETSAGTLALTLPPGGPDLLRLGDELRSGLVVDLESLASASLEQTVTQLAGRTLTRETIGMGSNRQRLRLDAGGWPLKGRSARSSSPRRMGRASPRWEARSGKWPGTGPFPSWPRRSASPSAWR
jgi:hypothetical protein